MERGATLNGGGERVFEHFEKQTRRVNGVDIAYRMGGSGPALLLLHGHPQTVEYRPTPMHDRFSAAVTAALPGTPSRVSCSQRATPQTISAHTP